MDCPSQLRASAQNQCPKRKKSCPNGRPTQGSSVSLAVGYLGRVEMTEEELAPGHSSVAVNNCIRQLSYHKNNLHDPMAGGWGEVRA